MAEFSNLNGYDVKDVTARASIAQEVEDRTTAMTEFEEQVAGSLNEIAENIGALNTNIGNEATAREQAISEAINSEVSARNEAIAQAVQTEVEARNQAIASAIEAQEDITDTAIANAIANEIEHRDIAIEEAVQAETDARNEALANLNTGANDNGILIHYIENHVVKNSDGSLSNDGTGDCAVITGEGKVFVVDTFWNEGYEANTKPFLTSKGITKVDYVLITHYHADHVGGLQSLIEDFEVGRVIIPQRPNSTLYNQYAGVYDATIKFLNENNVPYSIAGTTTIVVSDALTINMYNTNHNVYNSLTVTRPSGTTPNDSDDGIYLDYNNLSVCYEFDYMGRKALFTGDINYTAMNNLVSVLSKVDVSTLPHHNHQSFIHEGFYAVIKPDIAVGMDTMNEYAEHNGEDPYTTSMGAYRKPARYLKANGCNAMSTFGDTIIVKLNHTGANVVQGYNKNYSDMVYIGGEYVTNQKIKPEPVTITLNEGFSFDRIHAYKDGNTVVINGQLRFTSLKGSMTGVVAGVCDHLPPDNVQCGGAIMKNGAPAYVLITASGNLYVYTNTAVESSYVAFNLSWIE